MSVLVDEQIWDIVREGYLKIDPFDLKQVQPASYDLKLSNFFRRFLAHRAYVDVKQDNTELTTLVEIAEDDAFVLNSHEFVLASSIEKFKFPNDIVGRLEGKSSLGRLGLLIHTTAGFFDPGFEGAATLELFNASPHDMLIYPGMPIAQMSFFTSEKDASIPYNKRDSAKYKDQEGPTPSKYHLNFQ